MNAPHIDLLEIARQATPVSDQDLAKLGPYWRNCLRINRCFVDDEVREEMTTLGGQVGICMPETNWLSTYRLQRYEQIADARVRERLVELFKLQQGRSLLTADLMVTEAEFERAHWQAEVERLPSAFAWIWTAVLTAAGTYWFKIPGAIVGGILGVWVGQLIAGSRRNNAIYELGHAIDAVERAKEVAKMRRLNAECALTPEAQGQLSELRR